MRVVTNTVDVIVKISDEDLLEKRWIPYNVLSKKIAELEKTVGGQSYKVRFYNSLAGGKYNTKTIAHIKCVDTVKTMVENKVSALNIIFERS